MPEIDLREIEQRALEALTQHGAEPRVAQIMADAITWAEARSNRICGLYYLESYCLQLRSKRVDGVARPVVETPRPAQITVDAMAGFAQVGFAAALDQALHAARTHGVARLELRNAHTCTALGWFTEQIAQGGAIGLGMTNATPIVAPPGGKTRVIGTNPISFAVPDGAGGVSMLFDQSTTTVALGRITMAQAAGEQLEPGWALDAQGQPTTDPAAALAGSMTSAGGYKGWGFGLMAEILAACLCGGTLSRDVKPLKKADGDPHGLSCFFMLIDPGAEEFYERFSQLAESVTLDEGCRMPGQGKELLSKIQVPDALWARVMELAAP